MTANHRDLIITAASESYRPQLLALLGSLRCNWPNHPPVIVYDIGLSEGTPALLSNAGYEVRAIPPFVEHWRKHYTWKLWCMNDAPAERVLWLDAGCCILRPLPEIFDIVGKQGYFAVPNYHRLEIEASEAACKECDVPPSFRAQKVSVNAAIFGFLRGSIAELVVQKAHQVSLTERAIKATNQYHRHDQAILSLLLYRNIVPLILCDGTIYFNQDMKARFNTHAIWAARRGMHQKDLDYYASSLFGSTTPHLPRSSIRASLWFRVALQIKLALVALKRSLFRQQRPMDGVK